jgi:hypothetical protein
MDDPYRTYQENVEALHQTVDQLRQKVQQGQEETRDWPSRRQMLQDQLLPGLRIWRRQLLGLQVKPDLKPLNRLIFWLRLRYTNLWLNPIVARARLKHLMLSLEWIVAWVWIRRWQIARIVFVLIRVVVVFALLIIFFSNLEVIWDFVRQQLTSLIGSVGSGAESG